MTHPKTRLDIYYPQVPPGPKHQFVSNSRSTMSISCGRRDALRTALYILWMLIRHPRSTVTFEAGES